MLRWPTLWDCHHCTAHRLGPFSQRRTELGGSGLHPVPLGCESTAGAGPEVLPNAVLWPRSQRVPQLWPHGQPRALQSYQRHIVEVWQSGCGRASDRSREIHWWASLVSYSVKTKCQLPSYFVLVIIFLMSEAPTVLTEVTESDPVMQKDIFGPVLPVLTVSSLDDAIVFINKQEKPLCVYAYSCNNKVPKRQ